VIARAQALPLPGLPRVIPCGTWWTGPRDRYGSRMANPLVPTAYDVVMMILSLLVVSAVIMAVVLLVRRSRSRLDAQVDAAAQAEPPLA